LDKCIEISTDPALTKAAKELRERLWKPIRFFWYGWFLPYPISAQFLPSLMSIFSGMLSFKAW
jgi:hypothetical protein